MWYLHASIVVLFSGEWKLTPETSVVVRRCSNFLRRAESFPGNSKWGKYVNPCSLKHEYVKNCTTLCLDDILEQEYVPLDMCKYVKTKFQHIWICCRSKYWRLCRRASEVKLRNKEALLLQNGWIFWNVLKIPWTILLFQFNLGDLYLLFIFQVINLYDQLRSIYAWGLGRGGGKVKSKTSFASMYFTGACIVKSETRLSGRCISLYCFSFVENLWKTDRERVGPSGG